MTTRSKIINEIDWLLCRVEPELSTRGIDYSAICVSSSAQPQFSDRLSRIYHRYLDVRRAYNAITQNDRAVLAAAFGASVPTYAAREKLGAEVYVRFQDVVNYGNLSNVMFVADCSEKEAKNLVNSAILRYKECR